VTRSNSHVKAVRERLQILLGTYQKELKVNPIQAQTGDIVIVQGQKADSVVLLKRGQLVVELEGEGKTSREIARVEAGEILGEMGLFGDSRYSASVRVKEGPAELLFFDSAELMKFALFDSELVMEILSLSSARCRAGNNTIDQLLSGLEALSQGDQEMLNTVCQNLEQESEGIKKASKQFQSLFNKLSS
jgi:CRP-like cAMP-binding protein